MDATKKRLMTKLFKLLMVLLIPLFSLTVTSCGDGDDDENKDEPNNPTTLNSTFLIGTWIYEYDETGLWSDHAHVSAELTFKKDGQYYFKKNYTTSSYTYTEEEIGTYSYRKEKLSTQFSLYSNGVFALKSSDSYDILFDEYTSKLVIYNSTGSGILGIGEYTYIAQYSKQ